MADRMVGFGYKQAWLAVRQPAMADVLAVLGFRDLGPVGWRDGIDLAYLTDDRLVVTPPLPGAGDVRWSLVVGRWLLTPDRVDVAALGATLGTEVQFFASYRVAEMHRWERAVGGTAVRRFGYLGESGEVTTWHGDPDDAERDAGLPPGPDDSDILVSEHDVMRVAGHWSLDPTSLEGRPAPGPLRAAAPGSG